MESNVILIANKELKKWANIIRMFSVQASSGSRSIKWDSAILT
jgi:hypothetical protein